MSSNPASISANNSQPQAGRQIFQRLCQSIQKQVLELLHNLSVVDNGQINIKILQKNIVSTKNSIIKMLSLKLSQIIAIQQKFKSLVLQIDSQLNAQKDKCKQIMGKYQQTVLQRDKYKIQTVQLSELYQLVYKELCLAKQQKCVPQTSQSLSPPPSTSSLPLPMPELSQQLNRLHSENQQLTEKTQLLKIQIGQCMLLIEEMKENQRVANERIAHLVQENANQEHIIGQMEETNQMLKGEVMKMVTQLEQLRIKGEDQVKAWNQEKISIQEGKQRQIDKLTKNMSKLNQQLSNLIKRQGELSQKLANSQKLLQQKQKKIEKLQQIYSNLSSQKEMVSKQIEKYKKINEQLLRKANSIKDISKNQQKLEQKYTKKIQLLTKQIKQINEKYNFYKTQNSRLYEAMDQYAAKQIKITNQLHLLQKKYESQKQSLANSNNLTKKLSHFIKKLQQQLKQVKASISFQLQSIKTSTQHHLSSLHSLSTTLSAHIHAAVCSLSQAHITEKSSLLQQIQLQQQQYKCLQQKTLQSEQNSNKIANALLDGKKEIMAEIVKKDGIIRMLEEELGREREISQSNIFRLGQVVRKYENVRAFAGKDKGIERDKAINRPEKVEGKQSGLNDLEERIAKQRNRFVDLQLEYKSLLTQ